ncbi:uncharacterized protein DUF4252 [Gelidibacter algens]|jgi:hypothetical protein|uniref:Uncharacterized protein DUF4252 n=1 Tax=Gelidibacter algens TaxID=49280 RepID=A0A1A7R1G0_9FLAO|nr:DUF4252 domain-containing protein [Gelidibacter algens]OBX24612.1 hypothetical protein A9996_14375 [Gelidibacter algens]RAJ27781.1 uncharacterized protein DUF4252 [Gelidibacter algens]
MKKLNNLRTYLHKASSTSKKTVVLLAIMIAPMVSFGQSFFDKYESMKGVTSGVISQKMFKMIATIDVDLDDPEAQGFLNMVKKIESIKVLSTGDKSISSSLAADAEKYIGSSKLDELMRFKDGNQTVKFYVKEGRDENHVKELLMYINGLKELTKDANIEINGEKREIETIVVSIIGDVDLREISKITSKMNVPGGQHLEKASKGKKQ